MGTSPTLELQGVKEKVSLPCQALRIQHSEQAAGWLSSFADHPTASGKTRYMWLQSPVRVACGKFAHGCSPACSTFYSEYIYNCQPVWLPRLCCCVANNHDSAVTKRGGEPEWQQPADTVPMLQGGLEGTGAKADPWGPQKEGGQVCKASSELCEGQYMSQLGTKAAVLSTDQQLQVSVWNTPLAGKLAKTNSNRH